MHPSVGFYETFTASFQIIILPSVLQCKIFYKPCRSTHWFINRWTKRDADAVFCQTALFVQTVFVRLKLWIMNYLWMETAGWIVRNPGLCANEQTTGTFTGC